MASGSKKYEVMIRSIETVVPVVLVQEHILPQSNFDLLLPPIDVGVFFCFQKPTATTGTEDASVAFTTFPTMVAVLKEALSKVLVVYYPLAGEMVTNSVGESQILCNNRGVDLIEAYADVELRELNLYNPDDSVEAKLVPKKLNGILCIQFTELRCGGVVVGCTFDHRAADAYSFNMFMSALANIAFNKPINQMPSFCRFLHSSQITLSSNSPDPIFNRTFTPLSLQPPPNQLISFAAPVNRIYYISAPGIARLQEIAGHSHRRGFPEIDFGWGKAAFGSYHCSRGGKVGYVMPIPQETTGDWVVYAQVAPSIVAAMEEEPSIFRPLTTEYFCQ
ncbi:hypothetical protein LUZ62_079870 [Rhynchospora pubera]|uniref:Uncharacterized protein n=1 Tax=Rhynchospora pubera TaxID=906938 RepID=A0AAV8BQU6_9POAL|nr:hypothetical protein LUZ62_079870 [Rhynchospora pubera]